MPEPKDPRTTHLLKAESSFGWMAGMPSGNALTYFRGSIDEAHTFLKERLAAVLTANPWLCARLVKRDAMHGVAMTWSDEGLAEALSALETNTSAILHLAPADLKDKLGLENPYKDLCRALTRSKLAVPVGKRCLKESRPLLSLCLIPTGASEFAVWLSMSHIIADGYTAYAILNMLLSKDEASVMALEPERDHSFDTKLAEAIGPDEKAILDFSLPGILNALGSHYFRKTPKALCFRLNTQAIEAEKQAYLQSHATQGKTPPFISANDIVTSTLGRMLEFTSLYMAMNLRGRIPLNPDAAEVDRGQGLAGNYESGIFFFEGDFDEPASIRSAQGGTRAGLYQRPPRTNGLIQPIPGFWKRALGRPGLVTNWSGWKATFELPGCDTVLHLPITELDRPFFESAIVFQSRPDEISVLIFSRVIDSMSQVNAFSPIFGAALSSELFPAGRAL